MSYPYYASTVTNHTHGLQNKTKLLPHNFFSYLNIFSVFFWRKTDMFRLWERKFSWYLFPQQSLAAFRTQVPIVKPLILQSTGLQRPCYLTGLKKQGDVALKGQPYHQQTPHMLNYFEKTRRILLQMTASRLQVNSLWNKLGHHWLHHLMFQKMALQGDWVSSW